MLQLDQLRSFMAVYRAGSMRRAATEMGLSQPAVSSHIKALEDQMGRPLFKRTRSGVAATAAGEDLARDCGPHLDALERLVAGAASPEQRMGDVYLGGPAEFLSAKVLAPLALSFEGRIRLRVALGLPSGLLRALAGHELDLVVSTLRHPGLPGIEFEPIFEEDFVLVASSGRAEAIPVGSVARDGPAALSSEPLISYGAELPIVRRYWRTVFNARLQRDAAVVVDDLRSVLAVVLAGAGVSVLPRYLCRDDLAAGRLVVLHEPPRAPTNTLYLAWRSGSLAAPAVAEVYDAIKRAASDPS